MIVLDVRLEEFPDPIGTLTDTDTGELTFHYAPAYLAQPQAYPISLSLPLREKPYGDWASRTFFQNLLP